ncbi:hypothetical protein MMC17_005849 [Xylographa soralifera]|nr:hypothetical protein [Xylographa soralifera]
MKLFALLALSSLTLTIAAPVPTSKDAVAGLTPSPVMMAREELSADEGDTDPVALFEAKNSMYDGSFDPSVEV